MRLRGQEDTSRVDRLHQLFARSLREIEAHASELAETETGAATIYEAGQLLAALRLWAQSLAGITGQVVTNDSQVRTLLQQGPDAVHEVSRLFNQIKPTLPILSVSSRAAGCVESVCMPQTSIARGGRESTIAALMMSVSGRAALLDNLDGHGVPLLRHRLFG